MTRTDPEKHGAVDLAGWTRRSVLDELRLSEVVDLYEELGFEVMLRPVSKEELGEECTDCLLAEPERYRIVYEVLTMR